MTPGMTIMVAFAKEHMELYDLRLNDNALVERYITLIENVKGVQLKCIDRDLTVKALRIALLKAFTEIGQIPTFPQHSPN